MSQEKHSIASFLLLWRSIGAEAKVTSNKVGKGFLPAATAQFIKQQCGWVLFGFSNFWGAGKERGRETRKFSHWTWLCVQGRGPERTGQS